MSMGLHDLILCATRSSRGSFFTGIITLLRLGGYEQDHRSSAKDDSLCEIQDFEPLAAQNYDPRFHEQHIKRIVGQEEFLQPTVFNSAGSREDGTYTINAEPILPLRP